MVATAAPGQIVILNGAPRSGKSSIAAVIQETFARPWMNLGVDVFARCVTPPRYQPGIGLRPGGERPYLEALLPTLYAALYDSVAAHSRHGLPVVVDIGHHEDYTRPLGILPDAARRLDGLPVLFVGVHCSLEQILHRRGTGQPERDGNYAVRSPEGTVPEPMLRWQHAAHNHGTYDLEVDTSTTPPEYCAAQIRHHLDHGPTPTAFHRPKPSH